MTTSYRSAQIKEMRTSRAWSQEQLAQMAGLDVRTIQRMEKGNPASFESLKSVASVLKLDVSDLLNEKKAEKKKKTEAETPKGEFLIRVSDGNQLFTLMDGAHAYSFNNDTLESDDDTQFVADFVQELHDWGELGNDIEPGERVRNAHEYTKKIRDLEDRGLWVFAGRNKRNFPFGDKPVLLSIFVVHVLRSTNPAIVTLDPSKASVFAEFK
jgi:transcriptional regulator with XRE-family HTH domain